MHKTREVILQRKRWNFYWRARELKLRNKIGGTGWDFSLCTEMVREGNTFEKEKNDLMSQVKRGNLRESKKSRVR